VSEPITYRIELTPGHMGATVRHLSRVYVDQYARMLEPSAKRDELRRRARTPVLVLLIACQPICLFAYVFNPELASLFAGLSVYALALTLFVWSSPRWVPRLVAWTRRFGERGIPARVEQVLRTFLTGPPRILHYRLTSEAFVAAGRARFPRAVLAPGVLFLYATRKSFDPSTVFLLPIDDEVAGRVRDWLLAAGSDVETLVADERPGDCSSLRDSE